MRRLAPALALLAGLTALPWVAQAATTHQVDIRSRAYEPPSLRIDAGDTVRWTNRDLENHTVTFTNDRESEQILPANSRTTTFDTPGTYRYRCDNHAEMQGTLTVRGASSSTSSTTRGTSTSTTQDPRGSAITAPPDTTTTTTTSTTTTTTTTMFMPEVPNEPPDDVTAYEGPNGNPDDVDGPGTVAALLLLATAGGAFLVTRRAFP